MAGTARAPDRRRIDPWITPIAQLSQCVRALVQCAALDPCPDSCGNHPKSISSILYLWRLLDPRSPDRCQPAVSGPALADRPSGRLDCGCLAGSGVEFLEQPAVPAPFVKSTLHIPFCCFPSCCFLNKPSLHQRIQRANRPIFGRSLPCSSVG